MALQFSYPDVSSYSDFDNHETLLRAEDPETGFKTFIAVHSTLMGPARGGCRYWPNYANDEAAIKDVLRLSKGMTFKTTLANLEYGGGKTVIVGQPGTKNPSRETMISLGHALNELGGIYETGEDVGTRTDDFKIAGTVTDFVRTRSVELANATDLPGGTPLYTAHGIYYGIKAAVKHKLGQDDLKGVRIAVKGLGNVAAPLCEFLHKDGALLTVTDIDENKMRYAADKWGATIVTPEEIITQDVDVYSPCALGGDVNDETIDTIKAGIIAGAANNQLARPEHAQILHEKGILYAPDYGINAGGVINVVMVGNTHDEVMERVRGIGDTLGEIFERSDKENKNTSDMADALVLERLAARAASKNHKACA